MNPNRVNCYFNLGIAYYKVKNYDEAMLIFQKYLDTNPKNASCIFYIGRVFHK